MRYERQNIQRMIGYAPGEQPATTDVIKLNTNENPYPPADAVMQSLLHISSEALRRYPQADARDFRQLAAQLHDIEPANVLAANGGDELLRLAITTFVEPGQAIGVAEPSYALYRTLAAIQDCPLTTLALPDDWSLPEDFAERMNAAAAKLVFVTNPHAPSGQLAPVARLAEIAARLQGVLLIDEAYVDFIDPQFEYDSAVLVKQFDNVLILRSLSKGYSLAGLRFGYGLGAASLIEPMLTKTKDSYNVDAIAQRLAIAALQNRETIAETWAAVRRERSRLREALGKMGFVCPPSQSNFLLAEVPQRASLDAASIYKALKQRNIFIRYFNEPRLRNKLRISIGTPEQNDQLLGAISSLVSDVPL